MEIHLKDLHDNIPTLWKVNEDFLVSINEKDISTDFSMINVLKEKTSYDLRLTGTSQNGERINVLEDFIPEGNLIFFSDTTLVITGPVISSKDTNSKLQNTTANYKF